MPIYTPTGFLDITNATLRTSNLEAENFKLNGGNIYVTTDFTTPPTLQLIADFGNVTSNTIQFSNDTTGLVTTANVSVGKDLTVAGDINFSGTFNQNGAPFPPSPWITTGVDISYTTGNVSVGKDLTVTGNALVSSNLTVAGNALVSSNLTVTGNALVSDDLTVAGNVSVSDDLTVAGNVSVSDDLTVTGNVSVSDDLTVTGNVSVSDDLTVTGNVSVSDDLTVTGNALVSSNLTVTGNVSVSDDLTVTGAASVSNVVTIGTTKTFVVKVGSNGKYEIDGVDRPTLQLHQHQTYIFDLSSSTLSGHPFIFSETASGSSYDTGITTTGAYGSTEKRTFVVPAGAPTTLYYYCTSHSGMGATASISSTAELMVSGRVESTDLVVTGTGGSTLGSGTTAQRPANPTLGTIRYNSTTGFMEAYAAVGWAPIAQPPTVTGLSPLTTLTSGGNAVRSYSNYAATEMPQPPNAVNDDKLGWSVAVSGNGMYALAGSPYDDGGGSNSGALHIYVRNASTNAWTHQQELVIPSITAGDSWGYTQHAVSLSNDGTYAVAGAQYHNSSTGRARVWVRNGTSWSHQQELTISSMPTGQYFGSGVDISTDGNYIIIGAYSDTSIASLGSGAGAAHIFIRSNTTWSHQASLPRTGDGAKGRNFGVSVGISSDGTYAIVGAPLGAYPVDSNHPNTGYAHMYIRSNTTWTHQALMVDPNGNLQDNFGTGVDISGDGNYAVMGANNDTSATGAGFVFVRNGTSWTLQQQLTITSAQAGDHAFEQLQISHDGEVIVASVRGRKVYITSGAVYGSFVIFTRVGTTWTQIQEITGWGIVNPAAIDNFGYCVGISSDGTMIVAGAYSRDTGGTDRGAMFTVPGVFSPIVIDSATQVFTATGTGIVSGSTVQLEGADGSLYSVFDATPPNAAGTQVTFKLGTLGASGGYTIANQPYKLKVSSTSGLIGTSTAVIGFAVGWTTAVGATLSFDINASETQTLVGTDGGGVSSTGSWAGTFSISPLSAVQALPAKVGGGTLVLTGSTGDITGQIAANQDGVTTTVTFRLTDNATGLFIDRAIDIKGMNELYPFTSPFTFTTGSARNPATPYSGGSLATYRDHSDYASAAWRTNPAYFKLGASTVDSAEDGFLLWTVPSDGTYTIKAYGAAGGGQDTTPNNNNNPTQGGYGAWTQGNFSLTRGEKILMIIGHMGRHRIEPGAASQTTSSSGGGGGTYVLKELGASTAISNASIYCIAGGGGGGRDHNQNSTTGGPGIASQASEITSGGGGAISTSYGAGGGAGYFADGGIPTSTTANLTAQRPGIGSKGGWGSWQWGSTHYHGNKYGGFGGGSGNGAHDPGNGGGYTGGGGVNFYSTPYGSMGGTSRNNGITGTITFGSGTYLQNGSVIITRN